VSRVSPLGRLLWCRPATWLQALAYSMVMLVLTIGIGVIAGRPDGWLLTAGALSLGTLLAGLLHVASRPD